MVVTLGEKRVVFLKVHIRDLFWCPNADVEPMILRINSHPILVNKASLVRDSIKADARV